MKFWLLRCKSTVVLLVVPLVLFAQSQPPKHEFRGAWIATVTNLDWPSSPTLGTAVQQSQLVTLLDGLKNVGINAVIFQVRCESDALYNSSIDPWSYWLTGQQGTAPSPYYDPLQFAIEQAHSRGLELHAWFNPYRSVRAVTGTGAYTKASNHVSVLHPDWNIQINNIKFLDPGLPQVRDYITTVVMDIVRRYDIDGIHADDYFYPYPPDQITNQDDSTFAKYSRGIADRGNWRRDNVNLLIKAIHDSLVIIKPKVKFGMSPFGIWRNNTPAGITGMDAYSTIYCDALTWLWNGWVDYITPQLYWKIGGPQDYLKLMPWWADSANAYGRYLFTGQAPYRIASWSSSELPNQIRANRSNPKVQGSVFFRAGNGILDNLLGFADSLRTDLYRYPALIPAMPWKDNVPPNSPRNLRYQFASEVGGAALKWDVPLAATDGDSASRYVVYRFDHGTIQSTELDAASNILATAGASTLFSPSIPSSNGAYYIVTALDRNNNESQMSNILSVTPPPAPLLASPASGTSGIPDSVVLRWNSAPLTSSYRLQAGFDSTFTSNVVLNAVVNDTMSTLSALSGQLMYYWRANSMNAGGTGSFSPYWSFVSAVPVTPNLSYPGNFLPDVPVNLTLQWNKALAAASYRIQVSKSLTFNTFFVDTTGIADTSLALQNLDGYTIYYWRVRASNTVGPSPWSAPFKFRTVLITLVASADQLPQTYELSQNYPNPFNPYTTIEFSIPKSGFTSLRVYDLLGREVAILQNDVLERGSYRVKFEGSSLPTGTYFYVLTSGSTRISKKMILLK